MELLFVLVIAAAIGGIVRYVLPGRRSHGLLLLPAVDVVATAILWVGLTWLGWSVPGWLDVIVVAGVGMLLLGVACLMFSRTE